MTHRFSFACCFAPVLALLAAAPGPAAAQGYTGYPYSIMTRESGSAKRHQGITAVCPNAARAGDISDRAPSSKASMACRGPQAIATWARVCGEVIPGRRESGEPWYP
jgi:hypothetical protein